MSEFGYTDALAGSPIGPLAPTTIVLGYSTFETPVVADETLPVVGNFTPATGTDLGVNEPIEFDVTDDSGSFARVIVVASLAGVVEVVHDGTQFRGNYAGSSSRSWVTGGYHYTVLRRGGWTAAPTFEIFAIDAAGNEAT